MKKLFIIAVLLLGANILFCLEATLIPVDALLRVEVNVKKLLDSSYYKEFKASPKGQEAMQKLQKVKDLLGIDPEKSINTLEFYAAKPKNKKDKQILFYIDTNLKNAKIKALIDAETKKKGSKVEELEVNGFETLKVTPKNKDVGFIVFLSEGHVAVCSEAWLEEAITNFKTKKVVNKKLAKTEPVSEKMMINAALIVPEEAKKQMAMKPPAAPFSKVDMLFIGINSENKGFEINIILMCDNEADATTISSGLNGFMMMGRMFLQQKNLAEVLDYLKISLDKAAVTLNLKMDEKQLKDIAEKLKKLNPAFQQLPGRDPTPQKKSTPEVEKEK